MKRYYLFLFFLLSSYGGNAQDTQTMTLKTYLDIIRQYHPVAKQANLLSLQAKAQIRMAWGGFDPKLSFTKDRKEFDGTEYFDFTTPEIKLPLWFGIDLKANYTQAEGAYLNPENKLPKEGLSYLGVSVPLGQGLWIDQRRAAIKQANIFKQSADNERFAIINDLFLEASATYFEWCNTFLNKQVQQNAFNIAKIRFSAIKKAFEEGDRPAIDTLEALTILQNREFSLNEANVTYQNQTNLLVSYLWLEDGSALEPTKFTIKPDSNVFNNTLIKADLLSKTDSLLANNPFIKAGRFKIEQLNVERRLKAESLKPIVNVQLGLLNANRSPLQNINPAYWQNNNKFGLQISMPLTLTKERAALKLAKLKIQDATLTLENKQNDLLIKCKNYLNDWQYILQQISLYEQNLQANKNLFQAEETKFRAGESSLFLINSREQKVLETQEKLNELKAKRLKTEQGLNWLAGSIR